MNLYPIYCTNPECLASEVCKVPKIDDYKTFDEYIEDFKVFLDSAGGEFERDCFTVESTGFLKKIKKPACPFCKDTELCTLQLKFDKENRK